MARLPQVRTVLLLLTLVVLAACNRPQPAGAGSGSGSSTGSGSGSGSGSGAGSDATVAPPTTAFGATSDDDLRGELRVAHTLQGTSATALESVVLNWNRHHAGLQIQLRGFNPADLATASTDCDLVIARHDALDDLRAARRLRPIPADPAGQHLALPEVAAALQQPTGVQHSRPLFFDTEALWFRRDRLTTPPTDWSQPAEGHVGKTPALHWVGNGLEVLVALGQTADGPAPALGFAAVQDWQRTGVGTAHATVAELAAALNSGAATRAIGPAALLGAVDKHAPVLPALLPALPGGAQPRPWLDVWAVATTSAARQPEVAERIARLLASDETGLAWYELGRKLPASAKFYENARWASHPVVRVFRAQLRHAVARPPLAVATQLEQTHQRALQAAATPGLLATQAWETAAQVR